MSKKGMLTIKELADSLDLPKSKINYQVSKLDSNYIVVLNGIKHVTKNGQKLIKQALGIHEIFEDSSNLNTNLDGFEQFFKHFESQLNAKNKQIDKLHTLLDQQQQLTLQSNKQIEQLQIQLDMKDNVQSVQNEPDSSKVTESIEQLEMLNQLKNELEKTKSENEQLKNTISGLNKTPKKGFWKRLFNS